MFRCSECYIKPQNVKCKNLFENFFEKILYFQNDEIVYFRSLKFIKRNYIFLVWDFGTYFFFSKPFFKSTISISKLPMSSV